MTKNAYGRPNGFLIPHNDWIIVVNQENDSDLLPTEQAKYNTQIATEIWTTSHSEFERPAILNLNDQPFWILKFADGVLILCILFVYILFFYHIH